MIPGDEACASQTLDGKNLYPLSRRIITCVWLIWPGAICGISYVKAFFKLECCPVYKYLVSLPLSRRLIALKLYFPRKYLSCDASVLRMSALEAMVIMSERRQRNGY